jgi:large repetitive protein
VGHWENDRGALTVFASKDNLRQVVDEVPGKGISGPYNLRFPNGVQNTEKVEILVRDRNAPSVILRVTPQVRLVDYDFEPFSGRLLFKSPIPSLDENLNPVSIRVSYEVEEGGPKYWVGGVEGSVKLGENIVLGASYAKDENPLAKFSLTGVNATVKLGDQTRILAEVARSDRGDITAFGSASLADRNTAIGDPNTVTGAAKGNAWRLELRHQTERLEGRAYAQRADEGFTNTASSAASGRTEAGGKATYALTESVRLIGEGTYSKDLVTDGKRSGAGLSAAWDVWPRLTLEAGVRYAEQTGAGATIGATAFPGTGIDPVTGGQTLVPNAGLSATLNDPYKTTSLRLKGTYRPTSNTSVFAEAEQAVDDSAARAWAVGGDYRFSEVGRVYGRSEWASGVSGSYGLAGDGRQSATIVGVDAQYIKDGQVFSEYRLRDALAGREATAAVGLRNYWPIREGLRLNTTLERIRLLSGQTVNPVSGTSTSPEATAAGIGVDYTANPLWKGSARLEWRKDDTSKSWLNTAALARKLSDDWTLLARNYFYRQNFDDGGKNHQNRFQIGAAWRETQTNTWNALGKYEYRKESTRFTATQALGLDDLDAKVHILSLDAEYHPRRPVWYAGKVAGKWRSDVLAGETSKFDAQLLQARVIWDITNRWDVSVIGSVLGEDSFRNRRVGVGAEVGRVITDNLWLSAGYNWRDLKDKDLLTDYSYKGPFIRLRYKFDENLFKRGESGTNKNVVPTNAAAQ